jgi:transposase
MSDQKAVRLPTNGVKTKSVKRSVSPSLVQVPDPEVVPRAKRRIFITAYKLRILNAADRCTKPGEMGALLRSEGLYSSNLSTWRRQRERGELGSKKRGRPGGDPSAKEIARLRAQNARLAVRLEKAEAIIEVQKKLSVLLGLEGEPTGKADGR